MSFNIHNMQLKSPKHRWNLFIKDKTKHKQRRKDLLDFAVKSSALHPKSFDTRARIMVDAKTHGIEIMLYMKSVAFYIKFLSFTFAGIDMQART